ncbi:hypothetical protein ACWG0P_07275 [Amedibacillus sp. YH-ame6]
MSYILSIDPGNEYSAYSLLNEELKPIEFGKITNKEMIDLIISKYSGCEILNIPMVIEMIGHYGTGMPAGKTVFDTCVWIGRFTELYHLYTGFEPVYLMRREEKINLCGNMKAKDGNIRQALIDRFGVVGTKKNQGWFYGVSKDVWQAIAVGVTYHDKKVRGEINES